MSAYKPLKFKITGVAPLLMHNGQTADPLNPHSRAIAEITSKRKKTEADHAEIARREWYAGLYLHGSQPCIPTEAIEAALVKGAMKEKQGPAAKARLIIGDNRWLLYKGHAIHPRGRLAARIPRQQPSRLTCPVSFDQPCYRKICGLSRYGETAWGHGVSITWVAAVLLRCAGICARGAK